MKISNYGKKALLQFLVLSVAILVASGLPSTTTASLKTPRVKARMTRGKYTLNGKLLSKTGACKVFNPYVIMGSIIPISADKNEVIFNSLTKVKAKLNSRGKFTGKSAQSLSLGASTISEQVEGKFKYHKKKKQLDFKGTQTISSVVNGQQECKAVFKVHYVPVKHS